MTGLGPVALIGHWLTSPIPGMRRGISAPGHDGTPTTCPVCCPSLRPPPPAPPAAPAERPRREIATAAIEGLTIRQAILHTAHDLSRETPEFTTSALVVRAWELYPGIFRLRDTPHSFPDSNRVLAKLSGADGVIALGWLDRAGGADGRRLYCVTAKGVRELRRIVTERGREARAAIMRRDARLAKEAEVTP